MKHTFLQRELVHILGPISCPPDHCHVYFWIPRFFLHVGNDNIVFHQFHLAYKYHLNNVDFLFCHLKRKKIVFQAIRIDKTLSDYSYWYFPLWLKKSKRQLRVATSLLKCRRKTYCERSFIVSCKLNLRPHNRFDAQTHCGLS